MALHSISKRALILLGLALSVATAQAQKDSGGNAFSSDEWNDKTVFEHNKIYPRSNVTAFANENAIEKGRYRESPYFVSLAGDWHADVQADFHDRVDELEGKGFTGSAWPLVVLPNARVLGANHTCPVPDNVYGISSKGNYTITYWREFEVEDDWEDYDAYLQLRCKSAYYLWVNQQYVGFSEDSRTLSEFNITKFLKFGKTNNVTLQVVSTSDGSLLEMGADPSLCGVYDVAISLKHAVNVQDYSIKAAYNAKNKVGTFEIDVNVANRTRKGKYYIEVELWNPNGKVIDKMGRWAFFDKRTEATVSMDNQFSSILPWSAESPNLYTVVIRVLDKDMQLIESAGTRVGFRSLEMNDGRFLLNGRPVTLRGVVYADYTQGADGILSRERMLADVKMMKQNNINAVRTAYYSPIDPYFYELCDEYGLYVVCDANIQPFSNTTKAIATDNDYSNLFVVRAQNMYERYKNHTSIIAWSLGMGRDNGACMTLAYKELKRRDATRPTFFSGAEYGENSDFIALNSGSTAQIRQYLAKPQSRPCLMASFGSAQGNTFGGMERLWLQVRDRENLQGGFVDCWNPVVYYNMQEQKLEHRPGLVDEQQNASPALQELRGIYRPVDVRLLSLSADAGEFSISNLSDFSPLSDYILEYRIFTNLKPRIIEGEVNIPVPAGETRKHKLSIPKLMLYSGEELFIRFTLRQRHATEAVPKGTELCSFFFQLPMETVAKQPLPQYNRRPITLQEIADAEDAKCVAALSLSNGQSKVMFDMRQGWVSSYQYQGRELLTAPLQLSFWRPPTDNDLLDPNGVRMWHMLAPGRMQRNVVAVNYRKNDDFSVSIDVLQRYLSDKGQLLMDVKQTYLFLHSGDLLVSTEIVASDHLKTLPRVGYLTHINKQLQQSDWFGLDKESYRDRSTSCLMGSNSCPTDQLFHRYNRPQESGSRQQCRWAAFHDASAGLFVALDTQFAFTAYPFDDQAMAAAESFDALAESSDYTLHVDYQQSGIGCALGGTDIDEKDLIKNRHIKFQFHCCGYDCLENDPFDFCRIAYPEVVSGVLDMPSISADRERFDGPMTITLTAPDPKAEIRYTLDGSMPSEQSSLYKGPIVISQTSDVNARAFKKGETPSFVAYKRFSYDYIQNAKFDHKANTPYNFNSSHILMDGELGEIDDLSRAWLGFSGNDFGVVLQLAKAISVENVEIRFAHVPEAWVFAPTEVAVYVSSDGQHFSEAGRLTLDFDPASQEMSMPQIVPLQVAVDAEEVTFLRVVAKNLGHIPDWHRAKGLKPWLMVDEIKVNEK